MYMYNTSDTVSHVNTEVQSSLALHTIWERMGVVYTNYTYIHQARISNILFPCRVG